MLLILPNFRGTSVFSKSASYEMIFHGAPIDFSTSLHIQSVNKTKCSVKGGEMDIWLVLFWTGPIGVGIFLLCVGGMVYLLKKADEIDKRTKAFEREKGLEKKKE